MMGYGGYSWIFMIVNMVIMLAVIIGIVFLVVWAVRRTGPNVNQSGVQAPTGQTAKEIANTRYAKGEITRDEHQQILADLAR